MKLDYWAQREINIRTRDIVSDLANGCDKTSSIMETDTRRLELTGEWLDNTIRITAKVEAKDKL